MDAKNDTRIKRFEGYTVKGAEGKVFTWFHICKCYNNFSKFYSVGISEKQDGSISVYNNDNGNIFVTFQPIIK